MNSSLYLGLMSGTSVDGVDTALLQCSAAGLQLLATHAHPIPADLRRRIDDISQPGEDEIERLGSLDRELGTLFAEAANSLLQAHGFRPRDVAAIGSHGQTIRHRPPSAGDRAGPHFTLQIGDPNTIAELTGITTVADFRRRDMAAGGEGAPLAPAFHAAAFSRPGARRAVVNIGGISNISLLDGPDLVAGYDTGPGNTLMDHWVRRHRNEPFDRDGAWSAAGEVCPRLLQRLLQHPHLLAEGPRSTGKEAFNLPWLEAQLAAGAPAEPRDVMATLAEFTATTIADAIAAAAIAVQEVYICGGGAHNADLMRRLAGHIAPRRLATSDALGIDPDWVEAAAFAWLAWRTVSGLPGNAPAVTGAAGQRVLGAIYPA